MDVRTKGETLKISSQLDLIFWTALVHSEHGSFSLVLKIDMQHFIDSYYLHYITYISMTKCLRRLHAVDTKTTLGFLYAGLQFARITDLKYLNRRILVCTGHLHKKLAKFLMAKEVRHLHPLVSQIQFEINVWFYLHWEHNELHHHLVHSARFCPVI